MEEPATTPTSARFRLSKSKYLAGLQCLKRLYLDIHHPHLATPPDASTRAMLEMGSEIGELARRRFPGGRLVNPGFLKRDAVLAETAGLMADDSVPAIFEGAFQHDGVMVRVDILQRVSSPDGQPPSWRLIEVKSSSRVKDVHLNDLAIQTHVLRESGIPLMGVSLMHVNTQYFHHENEIDLEGLFNIVDVTEAVASRRTGITEKLDAMRLCLVELQPPSVQPGAHCDHPYECHFWNHCTERKPARWIHYLPGSKDLVSQLIERGVQTIDEIPDDVHLSSVQRRVKDDLEWVSEHLAKTLCSVEYPVHHLDFETVMLPVPRFPSTRPYQAIPFQWSNHREEESGDLVHQEYLHHDDRDPRTGWAEALIESLGDRGTICVYSSYEQAILEQVMAVFPQYREPFQRIIARLWDLLPVIRNHYYHPGFRGSYSIKAVSPAVIPSLAYRDLAIQDGGQAANAYYRLAFVETDWIELASLRHSLLQYCQRDTMAMVQLRKALAQKAGIVHPPIRREVENTSEKPQ
ncbi:MAG TPA: DUF2779 domain-containing protein [Nitrospira sp.]|nr:DUF2779 domain-containing protein [Nitrospira sp.]